MYFFAEWFHQDSLHGCCRAIVVINPATFLVLTKGTLVIDARECTFRLWIICSKSYGVFTVSDAETDTETDSLHWIVWRCSHCTKALSVIPLAIFGHLATCVILGVGQCEYTITVENSKSSSMTCCKHWFCLGSARVKFHESKQQ